MGELKKHYRHNCKIQIGTAGMVLGEKLDISLKGHVGTKARITKARKIWGSLKTKISNYAKIKLKNKNTTLECTDQRHADICTKNA